jgi:hypothetical protein
MGFWDKLLGIHTEDNQKLLEKRWAQWDKEEADFERSQAQWDKEEADFERSQAQSKREEQEFRERERRTLELIQARTTYMQALALVLSRRALTLVLLQAEERNQTHYY